MKDAKFYIVDVFAENRFAGNQVAVIKCCSPANEVEMQKVAREMNFKETCFITSEEQPDGTFQIRIFTPEKEVDFSGHAALGTAFIINKFYKDSPQPQIKLQLISGNLNVDLDSQNNDQHTYWMEQQHPIFGKQYEPILLSKILSIEHEEIDTSTPIQEVSTGLPMIIVPILSLETMKSMKINRERYYWLTQRAKAKCILAFARETINSENNMHVRVFADFFGIPEDSATGSGNGALAGYCAKFKVLDEEKVDLRIEQGYEIDRPSLILARASPNNDDYDILVGGQVQLVAEGKFIS